MSNWSVLESLLRTARSLTLTPALLLVPVLVTVHSTRLLDLVWMPFDDGYYLRLSDVQSGLTTSSP